VPEGSSAQAICRDIFCYRVINRSYIQINGLIERLAARHIIMPHIKR
jgi:hypothetical protein